MLMSSSWSCALLTTVCFDKLSCVRVVPHCKRCSISFFFNTSYFVTQECDTCDLHRRGKYFFLGLTDLGQGEPELGQIKLPAHTSDSCENALLRRTSDRLEEV